MYRKRSLPCSPSQACLRLAAFSHHLPASNLSTYLFVNLLVHHFYQEIRDKIVTKKKETAVEIRHMRQKMAEDLMKAKTMEDVKHREKCMEIRRQREAMRKKKEEAWVSAVATCPKPGERGSFAACQGVVALAYDTYPLTCWFLWSIGRWVPLHSLQVKLNEKLAEEYASKVACEARKAAEAEELARRLEEEELVLIDRLKKAQESQRAAYGTLQTSIQRA